MELIKLFNSILPPSSQSPFVFNAVTIDEASSHRLAKDSLGHPILLLRGRFNQISRRKIELKYLIVHFGASCTICESYGNNSTSEVFTVLLFKDGSKPLQEYFLQACESVLSLLPNDPTGDDIISVIYKYLEIFRYMEELPKKRIQGLWSELMIIAESNDPAFLINCWHVDPFSKYDFSYKDYRLEVKSTLSENRIHVFSYEQLNSVSQIKIIIASIIVSQNSVGLSALDIVEKINKRLVNNHAAKRKIEFIVAQSLGCSLEDAILLKFDFEQAANSLMYFDAKDVPKVSLKKVPEGISNIKFSSDLSYCGPIGIRSIPNRLIKSLSK